MLKIITTQLSEFLKEDHILQKHHQINPTNFDEMYNLFQSKTISSICIYDKTFSKNLKSCQIIPVCDHINNTGTNILIGHQKKLTIDFIDVSNLYQQKYNSIITVCCGKTLNVEERYPSHYMCHITTLARAMRINTIAGYLYNTR